MRILWLALLVAVASCNTQSTDSKCVAGTRSDCFNNLPTSCACCEYDNTTLPFPGLHCKYPGVTCVYEASEFTCTDAGTLACAGGRNCPIMDLAAHD
jgi:hypothetical protein